MNGINKNFVFSFQAHQALREKLFKGSQPTTHSALKQANIYSVNTYFLTNQPFGVHGH